MVRSIKEMGDDINRFFDKQEALKARLDRHPYPAVTAVQKLEQNKEIREILRDYKHFCYESHPLLQEVSENWPEKAEIAEQIMETQESLLNEISNLLV